VLLKAKVIDSDAVRMSFLKLETFVLKNMINLLKNEYNLKIKQQRLTDLILKTNLI